MRFGLLFVAAVSFVATSGATAVAEVDGGGRLSASVVDDLDLWTRRLSSDRAVDRGAAVRDLRRLAAEDVDVLSELAGRDDANVRMAAIDVLARWLRGDDEPRRAAAFRAMNDSTHGKSNGAASAAARLEHLERDVERQTTAEILRPMDPSFEFP
jgi:hypothetical protein